MDKNNDSKDPIEKELLMKMLGNYPGKEGCLETELGMICVKCSYHGGTFALLEWSVQLGRRVCPNRCGASDKVET